MGIREKLNQNPGITAGVTGAIIVAALAWVLYDQVFSGGAPKPLTQRFFTIDDGQTFFADDVKQIPPFDKDGKEAVIAHVFTCDKGRTKFVAYLERYKADAKRKLEDAMAKAAAGDQEALMIQDELEMTGKEVKKPGEARWVSVMDNDRAGRVADVKCPDGTVNGLAPVFPDR